MCFGGNNQKEQSRDRVKLRPTAEATSGFLEEMGGEWIGGFVG